jgi:hypothetical protein
MSLACPSELGGPSRFAHGKFKGFRGHHCYLARVLLRGLKCPSSPQSDFKDFEALRPTMIGWRLWCLALDLVPAVCVGCTSARRSRIRTGSPGRSMPSSRRAIGWVTSLRLLLLIRYALSGRPEQKNVGRRWSLRREVTHAKFPQARPRP